MLRIMLYDKSSNCYLLEYTSKLHRLYSYLRFTGNSVVFMGKLIHDVRSLTTRIKLWKSFSKMEV